MSFEDKFKIGYEEYLKLPKATISGENRNAELYSKQWCYFTGRSFVHPNPHRHYTFIEFVYFCGKNEELSQRFIQPLYN